MIYTEFKDFLEICSSSILERDNEYIEWCIFERLELGAYSFISDEFMDNLLNEKYIDEKKYFLVIKLGKKSIKLLNSDFERNGEYIRNNSDWKKVFKLSDKILKLIEEKEKLNSSFP